MPTQNIKEIKHHVLLAVAQSQSLPGAPESHDESPDESGDVSYD